MQTFNDVAKGQPYLKIILWCHHKTGHSGRGMTINEVLVSGFKEFPQFTYCGVDLFGPFTDKNYKKELRRYGVMFTCLCSCAIHIETAYSLETDSFFA